MAGTWPTPDPINTDHFDNNDDFLTLARADLLKMIGIFNDIQAAADDGATIYTSQNPQPVSGESIMSGAMNSWAYNDAPEYGSFTSEPQSTLSSIVETVIPKAGIITRFSTYIPPSQNSVNSVIKIAIYLNGARVFDSEVFYLAGTDGGDSAVLNQAVAIGDRISANVSLVSSATGGILSHLTYSVAIT